MQTTKDIVLKVCEIVVDSLAKKTNTILNNEEKDELECEWFDHIEDVLGPSFFEQTISPPPIKDIFKKHLNAFLAQNITSKSEFQKAFERAEKEVLEQLNEYEPQLAHKFRLAVYWERRCKAAENFALFVPPNWESGSDKAKAYEKWQESKDNFPIPPKQ